MLAPKIFGILCALWWAAAATNDGLTNVVQWDQYSISINGSTVFIFSGEFHYQRMPVPEMWLDIFQKLKANGFNAISIYFFWSYHSPSKDVYDFETAGKNVQQLFDYAKEAGLWVIARAGPYCNAETTGGGLALWGSDGSLGKLRTSDDTYYQAWQPWVAKIGAIIAKNEITKGGPVILNQIENELEETTHLANNTLVLYMEQLKTAYRKAGITVPFTHNEKGERSRSWSTDYENVGGAVNMYGLDAYPGGMSCTNPNSGFSVIRNYFQWFSNNSYTQPNFFPEFEGGWFSPWGGSFYDSCMAEHEPAFADVFYKNNIGQRATLQSIYMAYGGTNWGHSAAPVVYSSYDYSAPLRETRQIQEKLYQTKLIGLFTRVSKNLLRTRMAGNGTGYASSSTSIWAWELRDVDNLTGLYVFQQNYTNSQANVTFDVNLSTSQGVVTVPSVSLNGRQSKMMVTDYSFGKYRLLYCSADILTFGHFDKDILVLYLQEGQAGQFALKGLPNQNHPQVYGTSQTSISFNNSETTITWTQGTGSTVVEFVGLNLVIYLLEQKSAWRFWAPPKTTNPDVAPDQQIFVIGPYLVRNASVESGTVHISGDNDQATAIEVYCGDSSVRAIEWNGVRLDAKVTRYGSITAWVPGTENRTVSLPIFQNWRSADSLPEKDPSYDDSKWTVCNKTTTLSPVLPLTIPVLFASDYGYSVGAKVYRGYFDGKNFTSVNLTCAGGLAFGWTTWLNGVLIGGDIGNSSLGTTSTILSLPLSKLQATNNVLTVVVDYHGHDETSVAKGIENPRGILGATLFPTANSTSNTGFKLWKIQGNAGGYSNIDPVRGPMNEGGLYGERFGWHLPSFDTSTPTFSSSSPQDGLNSSGIQFYITTFNLNIDSDLDVPLGIEISSSTDTIARVLFWINGYQFGKYVPHIGPQTRFPVPPGVINNRGLNTIAVSLWAMTDEGAKLDQLNLIEYGIYETSFGFDRDWSYLQPGWDEKRLGYA